MFQKNKIYLLIFLLLISACSKKNSAPIILKGHLSYYKNSYQPRNNSDIKYRPSNNIITIESGDNLYDISKRYNVSMRDLIETNNLRPPYNLKVNKKLKLPATRYHNVAEGENIYRISRLYGMNMNKLIKINHLNKPYTIIAGSKLKITRPLYQKAKPRQVASRNLEPASKKSTNSSARKSSRIVANAKIPYKNNKFMWPVKGKVISNFGPKSGGLYNDGINIKAPAKTPVKSVEDGMVAYVGNELRGYGNLVIVKHSGGWISAYAHLQKSKVKIGDRVKKGQSIANVGSTGNVNSPQLYFGIRKGREAVNPKKYLRNT